MSDELIESFGPEPPVFEFIRYDLDLNFERGASEGGGCGGGGGVSFDDDDEPTAPYRRLIFRSDSLFFSSLAIFTLIFRGDGEADVFCSTCC